MSDLIIINFLMLIMILAVTLYEYKDDIKTTTLFGSFLLRASLCTLIVQFYSEEKKWLYAIIVCLADPAFILSLANDVIKIFRKNFLQSNDENKNKNDEEKGVK